ncbi:MAG: flagellar basal-body MS-ring/collar protein FliF [Ignavibacteriales bacterium]|nr:flagellar basal-body MS-ring/collar protein FliF [Ignavibacteriales bacterium]
MAENRNLVADQASRLFTKLTGRQKALIAAVTVAVVIGMVVLVNVVNRPTYGLLFSNLTEQDASKIVEKLKEKSVPYTLEDGGKSILVPRQQLYELRLALASDGLPHSSTIGYEIFDRTNLGVSDFVQRINYRRALEGEISRTILQLDEVEGVRVHIVTPEKALFRDDEKPPTASVVLKLKSGKPLARGSAQGIAHLIASSVEGMDASNVTIVDSRGSMLSENTKSNSLTALSSTQYDLQHKVESYLAQKAQTLLDGALGNGNSMVQISAELDFRQVDRTLEQYDPDNTVVRSEQTTEEKSAMRDSLPPSTRLNTVTNYEVNKTVERIVENVGNIKRISVAAIVNQKQRVVEKDGAKSVVHTPRPQEEMDRLTELVKKAVGFNSQRNDEVSVVNLQFDQNTEEGFLLKDSPFANWYDIGEKVLMLLAMAGAVVVMRSLLNRIRTPFEMGRGTLGDPAIGSLSAGSPLMPREPIYVPSPEEEISQDALVRAERRNRIGDYIKKSPEDASRLLKVWLAE